MTEGDLVVNAHAFAENFLAGLGLAFSVVSAYVAALPLFLYRAPLLLRVMAFSFFTGFLIVLGLFMLGAYEIYLGLRQALAQMHQTSAMTPLGEHTLTALSDAPSSIMIAIAWIVGTSAYAVLFYMTFFFKWPTAGVINVAVGPSPAPSA